MHKVGASEVIYLDSDIYVTGGLDRVWSELGAVSLLLTPHHTSPPPLGISYTNEASIADFGMLNGGFLAWRAGAGADVILNWMMERFPIYGFCAPGMFVDQKLLPLLLGYFPDLVWVSRDPGLNIAYWNAHERAVRVSGGTWYVADTTMVFFHASGFKPSKPNLVCKYLGEDSNRDLLSVAPWLGPLIYAYSKVLNPYTAGERVVS
jgi:hypothetical protein